MSSTTSDGTNAATGSRSCSAGSRTGGALRHATTDVPRSSYPPSHSQQLSSSGYENERVLSPARFRRGLDQAVEQSRHGIRCRADFHLEIIMQFVNALCEGVKPDRIAAD